MLVRSVDQDSVAGVGLEPGALTRSGLDRLRSNSLLRSRLCWRIAFSIFLSILAIEAAILVPSYKNYERDLLLRVEQAGVTAIAAGFRHHAGAPTTEWLATGETLVTGHGLKGASLYRDDGRLIGTVGEAPDLTPDEARRTGVEKVRRTDGTRYEILFTPARTELPMTVVARLDASWIKAELAAFVWRISGLVLLISTFVSTATILILGRLILRPVLALRANLIAAQQDPAHAERYSVESNRSDELGDMTEALNQLLHRVSETWRLKLREREKRFQEFAAASSDWFWEMDENLRFSYFSERFTELTGVPEENLLGKTRQESGIPNVDKEAWQKHLDDLAAHRPFRDFAHPRTMPDGRVVWLSINGKPIFDDDGVFMGYRGTGSDITEAKIAEQRAADAHERLTDALESIPASFILYDADERLVLCNGKAEDFLSEVAELLVPGTPFEDITRAAFQKAVEAGTDEKVAEQGIRNRLERFRNPGESLEQRLADGRWTQVFERKTPNGSTVCIRTDITALKRVEEQLRESQQRLQAIMKYVPAGLFLKDSEARYLLINRQFQEWFGVDPDEAIGKTGYDLYPKERADRYAAGDREILANWTVTSDTLEIPITTGETRTFILTKFPIFDGDQGVGFGGVMIDVTKRARAEAQLAEHAKQLATTAAELQRSNAEFEQFAYVASHDLQEPLRMVGSYCQLLQRRYQGQLDSEADEFIGYAVDGATRMQHLINDLLDYSRVGRGDQTQADVDLSAIFAAILQDLSRTIEETEASITADPLPVVTGYETQLRQLLQNLIANAIKFHGEAPPEIYVSAERDGEDWVFSVRDNGIGINPEYAERIFLIFQRLHRRDEYSGTGIGLAVCKKIVERHDGRIWFVSDGRNGTTFHFTLPAHAQEDA